METKNECHTYFKIVGDFDPDVISARLGISPIKSWKIGDRRKNGSRFDFACWECGRCEDYDVLVENQMRKTISPLLDKTEILNRIREEFDLSFFLEIVPTIYADEISPCLAPPLDVIDFCHATRTQIDIDLYLYAEEDVPSLGNASVMQ